MNHTQFSGPIVIPLRFGLMAEDFMRAAQSQIERGVELANPIGPIGPIDAGCLSTIQRDLIPVQCLLRSGLMTGHVMRSDTRLVIVGREFPGLQIETLRIVEAAREFRLRACEAKLDHGSIEVHFTLTACVA
jgi:hypothetical protein